MSALELDASTRQDLWHRVGRIIEDYLRDLPDLPVAPSPRPEAARALLEGIDFSAPLPTEEALELVVRGLRNHQVHNGHPRYFGLFNPATTTMSLAADALVAAFNPQLAAWTHAPFACEVEQLLIRTLGARFGYPAESVSGSFTSGGAEANHTALLAAILHRFPEFGEHGARALPGAPVVYVTSESHHSFLKAARLSGIGTGAVRAVRVDERFVMDPAALSAAIEEDRKEGRLPLLVVATLGTTGAGLLDPMDAVAEVGHHHDVWVHADAAWGGAAALVPELARHFRGIDGADSITFDAHKWLSVPMGAGMFFTRHPKLLEKTFGVDTGYMPRAGEGVSVMEPHRTSMQWTRRFNGLKLFLSLLVAGLPGYEETIRQMVRLGELLRERLIAAGFHVVNQTPLPVVCFQDGRHEDGRSLAYLREMTERVVASGNAWVSIASLGGSVPAVRACISSFRTSPDDVNELVGLLERARPGSGENS